MTHHHYAIAYTLLSVAAQASAATVSCAEDPASEALFCYDRAKIIERDGIRRAALYIGGPNGVRPSGFSIAANCATGVLHLKDGDGVSFAGAGPGEGTVHSRRLRRMFCDETPRSPSKK